MIQIKNLANKAGVREVSSTPPPPPPLPHWHRALFTSCISRTRVEMQLDRPRQPRKTWKAERSVGGCTTGLNRREGAKNTSSPTLPEDKSERLHYLWGRRGAGGGAGGGGGGGESWQRSPHTGKWDQSLSLVFYGSWHPWHCITASVLFSSVPLFFSGCINPGVSRLFRGGGAGCDNVKLPQGQN